MIERKFESMARQVRTDLARSRGLGSKKNSGRRTCVFLDFPLYRTYQDLACPANNEPLESPNDCNLYDPWPNSEGFIHLGEFQQLLVVVILDLGEKASVAAIHCEMEKRMGGAIPVQAMLPGLERMEEKDLLRSHIDENVPERDGSQDRFFRVTPAGHEAFDKSVEYMRQIESGEIPRPPFVI